MHSFVERPRYFCAMGGALGTVEALPDTVAILHAASGCAGSIAWAQNGGAALQVGGKCGGLVVPSSNVTEKEVVFGGEKRLTEQISTTLEVMEAKLYVVLTGCVTEVIGDDVEAITKEFDTPNTRVIAASTGGFKGNSYYGYDLVLKELVDKFVKKPKKKKNNKVNILGIVPFMDAFWKGNLKGIRSLLERLGLEVNTYFTEEDSLEAIQSSSEAVLNIVVSDLYGIETAKEYEKKYQIPYIQVTLPIGPTSSANLLRNVAYALSLQEPVEEIIQRENKKYYSYIEFIIDCYNDMDLQKNAVIIGDVNYGVAVTNFLQDDLGWIPYYVQFTDSLTKEEEEKIKQRIERKDREQNPIIIFDTNTEKAFTELKELHSKGKESIYSKAILSPFVIGSSIDRELATELGAPHLSLTFPVANRIALNKGYTGFHGGLTLIEDLIDRIIVNR